LNPAIREPYWADPWKEPVMCYLVHERQAGSRTEGAALPPFPQRLRSRWAGAAALMLVGGLAVAALVTPNSQTELARTTEAAVPAALAARAANTPGVPAKPVVEQGAGLDDGVPGPAEVSKASAGNCHHGL
jgi:hypothetical protein